MYINTCLFIEITTTHFKCSQFRTIYITKYEIVQLDIINSSPSQNEEIPSFTLVNSGKSTCYQQLIQYLKA